jgi:hypothetical protein
MNPRERTLLMILLSILGCGVAAFVGYQWFYVPLTRHNSRIAQLQDEVKKSEDDLFLLNVERKKILEKARARSLPHSTERAISEFSRYLQGVLRSNSLTIDDLQSPQGPPPEQKQLGGAPQKKANHTTLTFQVRAKGDLPSLVAALEEMQNTPLVHRIKNLTVERADNNAKDKNPRLSINLVVEAMIVSKAPAGSPTTPKYIDRELLLLDVLAGRTGRPIGLAMLPFIFGEKSPLPEYVLHRDESKRNYGDIAALNIFTGMVPYVPPPVVVKKKKEKSQEETTPPPPPLDHTVLGYVRLVTTSPGSREAFLRNQLVRSSEMRVRDVPASGYDTFRIMEEDGQRVLFTAKVLRIEQRDVFLQIGKGVYRMHIGQTLGEALERALSEDQMEDLELTALYDADFAEKAGDTKKKSATKNTKGTPRKGGL